MSVCKFPSPAATETLRLELSVLQVLHHRNKNQHHLQQFFKHLSILKRTSSLLLDHPDSEFLLRKLRTQVIPQAWESFSRVVARGEFPGLGIVLLALVGRIAFCLGGVELNEEVELDEFEQNEENEEVGVAVRRHSIDEEIIEVSLEDHSEGNMAMELVPSSPTNVDDFPETESISHNLIVQMKGTEPEMPGDIQSSTKKKRKKKRMDEIDILFAAIEY